MQMVKLGISLNLFLEQMVVNSLYKSASNAYLLDDSNLTVGDLTSAPNHLS